MTARHEPPRVLLLTADYPPNPWSGIGVAVHRQAVDLAALGVSVRVIADDDPGPADWIHLHSLALIELALRLKERLGARLACTVHTQPWLELRGDPRGRFWLDAQTRLLGACDRAVFLSASELAAAQSLFPSLPEAVVIPNGVPSPPARRPSRDERRTVLFAGRFAASKGLALLEQCIRRVRAMSDVRFVLAGGHGDSEGSSIVQRIAREDAVEVTGWLSRDELDARLGESLIVLVPSRYEPFGLVALEAMRMGAPVLAANTGGLRETVRADSGGVLLHSQDPGRWAEEVLRIINDRALWTALHERGPVYVKKNYSSMDMAARLLREVYKVSS